jgi:hypothetical protein
MLYIMVYIVKYSVPLDARKLAFFAGYPLENLTIVYRKLQS